MPAITFTNLYILCLLWHCQWQDRKSQQLYWLAPARLPRHATPRYPTPCHFTPLCCSILRSQCYLHYVSPRLLPPWHQHPKWRAFAKNACWSHHHRSSKSGATATPNSFKYPLNLKSMLAHYASDNTKSQSQAVRPGTHDSHNIQQIFMSLIYCIYNVLILLWHPIIVLKYLFTTACSPWRWIWKIWKKINSWYENLAFLL